MYRILILLLILCINGCTNRSSLETYHNSTRTNNDVTAAYHEPDSQAEEYINRVAKRILLVTNRPIVNYRFETHKNSTPALVLSDHEGKHNIDISTGALQSLDDEAQLAVVLSMSIERFTRSMSYKSVIDTLYMAGYDPTALVELQQEYLYDKASYDWLGAVFPKSLSDSDIQSTKNMLGKKPQGLLRNAENYKQLING